MRRRLEPGSPADAPPRQERDALGADEPARGFRRVSRVRVLGKQADEPAVELLVQRREQERQHGLRDPRAGRQRGDERLQPLVLGELADEDVKGRAVHDEGRKPGFPRRSHRIYAFSVVATRLRPPSRR